MQKSNYKKMNKAKILAVRLVSICSLISICCIHQTQEAQGESKKPICRPSNKKPYKYPPAQPAPSNQKEVLPNWNLKQKRPFMRGVSLGLYFEHQNYDYDAFLKDISKTGASHVGFVISWYQKDVRSNKIERHKKKTVSDARLLHTIHQARARGLQVFLLPIVRLKHRGPDDWRGVLKPKNLDTWWRSYRTYMLHYARLSREHGVELFTVGSELVSMEHHRQRWLSLIRAVRNVFPGPLIYSANWDHYEPVTFWDALDYIGISNYYELSKKENPPIKLLQKSWAKIRKKVEDWKKKHPKQPLVFTEVGYYSQLGTNTYPWDYTRDKKLSLEAQRRCYVAFAKTWGASPHLKGAFFWNWFAKGGIKDKGYSPRGKPAECVMKKWFSDIKQREVLEKQRLTAKKKHKAQKSTTTKSTTTKSTGKSTSQKGTKQAKIQKESSNTTKPAPTSNSQKPKGK